MKEQGVRPEMPSMVRLPLMVNEVVRDFTMDITTRLNGARARVQRTDAELRRHLDAAMTWLHRSLAVTGMNGCSKGYSYLHGWLPPFPETSGYIATTFLRYHELTKDELYLDAARRTLDFVTGVQNADGGIQVDTWQPNHPLPSIIFNTGMCMSGWLRGYRVLDNADYLDAAVRAGDFLVWAREDEERWLQHSYNNINNTYHARVAWFLALLGKTVEQERYITTARNILDWVVAQQLENGWFENCRFDIGGATHNTHAFAYTCRGLLESYKLIGDERYLNACRKTSRVLRDYFIAHGRLPALFDRTWTPECRFQCLTGIAQYSIIWCKLYEMDKDEVDWTAACAATNLLCSLQPLDTIRPDIRGAIKGSHPVYGRYAPLQYPGWATKFFADALMQRLKLRQLGGA